MATSRSSSSRPHLPVIVMGVSGSGKTSIGEGIAAAFDCRFVEGDSLHPKANIEKMSAGIPLDDEDRWPWLDIIGRQIGEGVGRDEMIVVSCSALKKVYRDRLRKAAGGHLAFVFLDGARAVLEERMKTRSGHFMPASLLDSQFATLEPPTAEPLVVTVDVDQPIDAIVEKSVAGLKDLRAA